MSIKENELNELVGPDGDTISGDRTTTNNSEIETGPVQKTPNDDSTYEKGVSTTSDRRSRYSQNIPWFAVYSYRGGAGRGQTMTENRTIVTKEQLEKSIEEDLVKKSKKDNDLLDSKADAKLDKIVDTIEDGDLTKDQLDKIKQAVLNKLKDA